MPAVEPLRFEFCLVSEENDTDSLVYEYDDVLYVRLINSIFNFTVLSYQPTSMSIQRASFLMFVLSQTLVSECE